MTTSLSLANIVHIPGHLTIAYQKLYATARTSVFILKGSANCLNVSACAAYCTKYLGDLFRENDPHLLELRCVFLFTTDLAIVFFSVACVSGTVVTG